MIRTTSRLVRLLGLALTLVLLGASCGGDDEDAGRTQPTGRDAGGDGDDVVADGPDTPAALLRVSLDGLLQEHVYLSAAATGAAMGAREAELAATSAALEANSASLAATIASAFGNDAGETFAALWSAHTDVLVGYAGGGPRQALLEGPAALGTFISSQLPDADETALAELLRTQVATLAGAVDAQRSGDQVTAWTELRGAAAQMSAVAAKLAATTAAEFPDKLGGDPMSNAARLSVNLSGVLREHVYLTAAATGAALDARTDEFMAAAGALDANSKALTSLIAGVYDAGAGKAFDGQWKRHIGFFVDYTTGLAGQDRTKQDRAVADLLAYAKSFGALANSLAPALTADAVGDLLRTHVVTLKAVIDAQAAGDANAAYPALRTAADHMQTLASVWAGGVVTQSPDDF